MLTRRTWFGTVLAALVMPWRTLTRKPELGIAIRFVKAFDIRRVDYPTPVRIGDTVRVKLPQRYATSPLDAWTAERDREMADRIYREVVHGPRG